jgi:hypothetical protein
MSDERSQASADMKRAIGGSDAKNFRFDIRIKLQIHEPLTLSGIHWLRPIASAAFALNIA